MSPPTFWLGALSALERSGASEIVSLGGIAEISFTVGATSP
jgi:hypothetical protein